MKTITYEIKNTSVTPTGNWNTATSFLPIITVNQELNHVLIETQFTNGRQKKASVDSNCNVLVSDDKQQLLITGEVDCRNWINYKCSGTQKFCFAVFVGDTQHIYVHRSPATKGWLELNPNLIRKRLIKLGIGAVKNVLQQGDFLLKPANGSSLPVENFKHEWISSSHHVFSEPLLSEFVPGIGRIILIPDGKTVELHHIATDGIQHPTIKVTEGQWIIGTTATQLKHTNRRD